MLSSEWNFSEKMTLSSNNANKLRVTGVLPKYSGVTFSNNDMKSKS